MTTDTTTEPKTKSAKSKASKKSPAKKNDAKAKLAEGAKEIQKLIAKKEKGVIDNTKKPSKDGGKLAVIPPVKIVESKEPLQDLLEKYAKMSKDQKSITLSKETPVGAFAVIFDHAVGLADGYQFLIGELINQGKELPDFKGQFADAMARSGRSLSSLKAYASAAKNIEPSLRKRAPYTHLRQLVKVPQLEDKKRILDEYSASEKSGKPLSVKEVAKLAHAVTPENPKRKAPKKKAAKAARVTRELTVDETEELIAITTDARALWSLIEGASYLTEARSEITITLRENLERIARFSAQLSE